MSRSTRFSRPIGTRPYQQLFVISMEGAKTEPAYFDMLRGAGIALKLLKSQSKSAPSDVLKRLRAYKDVRKGDQLWLVIDKDNWTEQQIRALYDWVAKDFKHRGLAVSVPKFELQKAKPQKLNFD